MRNRLSWWIPGLILLAAGMPAQAQKRWEFSPVAGYETNGTFPITNSSSVDKLRADSGGSVGAFLDGSITESAQFEIQWNRNMTSYSAHDVTTDSYSKAYDSDIDAITFGFLLMFRGSERKLRPYAAGGLGFTHDWNDAAGVPDRSAFTYGIGGGVKYYATRNFGLRGDIRLLASYANSTPGIVCDSFGDCFTSNIHNYLKRGNFVGGFFFRF